IQPLDAFQIDLDQLYRRDFPSTDQFRLLFELVKVALHEPGQKSALVRSLADEIIESVQEVLERESYSKKHARIVATSILAQVRGLHLDLAISGDISRVDAAMRDYIDLIVRAADLVLLHDRFWGNVLFSSACDILQFLSGTSLSKNVGT